MSDKILAILEMKAERAALSLRHKEPDTVFLAREAGPELLDACDAVMAECLDLPPSVLNQLARAIAKARGES